MPIPPQKVILTIPDNKGQLNGSIVEDLRNNTIFPETPNIRRLVVTGEDPGPMELTSSVKIGVKICEQTTKKLTTYWHI